MESLQETVDALIGAGRVPGAVALVAEGADVLVATAGVATVGGPPMARDHLFRIASLTKPIVAAATMALIDRGRIGLDDPVKRWLPELTEPVVLRDPSGPLDDVVPALRPITVRHLLTLTSGHGLSPDFSSPVAERLQTDLHQGPPRPATLPSTDVWMARLADTPLLHQPGEGWTYNTGSDILGVLLSRVQDAPLGDVLHDTVLGPLEMVDTGFAIPVGATGRMTSSYRRDSTTGNLELVDPPNGQWTSQPAFQSGAGGLVSTVDDLANFGQMLLDGGEHCGRRVLSPEAVRMMMTSHVEAEPNNPFLGGHGWGFGGGVDLAPTKPWNLPGRYGWVGGNGTASYVLPSRQRLVVWLSQFELAGPDDSKAMSAVLTWAVQLE